MQTQHLISGAAGVAGFTLSRKYGSRIPGGVVGKLIVGGGIAIGGPMIAPDSLKGPVAAFGVGVVLDVALAYVGL